MIFKWSIILTTDVFVDYVEKNAKIYFLELKMVRHSLKKLFILRLLMRKFWLHKKKFLKCAYIIIFFTFVLYQQSLPFVKDGYPLPSAARRGAVLWCPPPPASDGGHVPTDCPQ